MKTNIIRIVFLILIIINSIIIFGFSAQNGEESSNLSKLVITKIAEILNTTPSYLMDGNENILNQKDEKDIAKKMDNLIEQIDTQDALMFDGEPLDEESKELLKISLENSLRMAKVIAKQKYTPKKYRK